MIGNFNATKMVVFGRYKSFRISIFITKMIEMPVFTKRLKEARKLAGMSQEQLGVRAGLEEASASARMNRYEVGTRVPDMELVERIAHVLDVPSAYFYAKTDEIAELLLGFHQLKQVDKNRILAKINELTSTNA